MWMKREANMAKPGFLSPDSAVGHDPFRHSRLCEAGIQEVRSTWMLASASQAWPHFACDRIIFLSCKRF